MDQTFLPYTPLSTAVLFLIFNRLDTTQQVFKAIQKAKPPRLYIAGDGARENKQGEKDLVKTVRDFVINNIDWQCEVKTLFREKNLGCKNAVSGAIDWFFENEEMGIILEDDCIPSQSFFWYCQEMLETYKDEPKIGIVSGSNFFFGEMDIPEDYYFSVFPFIWGWASWRRVWEKYDVTMGAWPDFSKDKGIENIFCSNNCIQYWNKNFERTYNNLIDTWDYQFSFMLYKNNYLNISPALNLISNIGFGEAATHTTRKKNKHENMPKYELRFPLVKPIQIVRSLRLDKRFEKVAFKKNIFQKIVSKIKI